jgi:hypothetical protein
MQPTQKLTNLIACAWKYGLNLRAEVMRAKANFSVNIFIGYILDKTKTLYVMVAFQQDG